MADGNGNESESRRERLKRRRSEAILEAAAAVFARKGFHPATMREIAELADVAEGTIYNYFTDKEDLLVAIAQRVIAESASEALAEVQVADDRDFMAAVLADQLEFASRNYGFIRALMTHVWTDQSFRQTYLTQVMRPLLDVLEGYLRQRMEAGKTRDIDTGVVVRAMLGGFLIFLLLADPGEGELNLGRSHRELAQELADFFVLGLQKRPE